MSKRIDLRGYVYGCLRVERMWRRSGKTYCRCECICGQKMTVWQGNLRNGHTTSCGCGANAAMKRRIHGETKNRRCSPEYKAYHHAKGRCRNPNNEKFLSYGARGIEFRFTDFSQFLKELGRRPDPGYSIDRINNDGHYEPGNVRWATPVQQARNRRTENHRWI